MILIHHHRSFSLLLLLKFIHLVFFFSSSSLLLLLSKIRWIDLDWIEMDFFWYIWKKWKKNMKMFFIHHWWSHSTYQINVVMCMFRLVIIEVLYQHNENVILLLMLLLLLLLFQELAAVHQKAIHFFDGGFNFFLFQKKIFFFKFL